MLFRVGSRKLNIGYMCSIVENLIFRSQIAVGSYTNPLEEGINYLNNHKVIQIFVRMYAIMTHIHLHVLICGLSKNLHIMYIITEKMNV
jgi:hypothetical protein